MWDDGGVRELDRIVTVEVMVKEFDHDWWAYRKHLETTFEQKEVVVRAVETTKV
jgi:hypothetical protein